MYFCFDTSSDSTLLALFKSKDDFVYKKHYAVRRHSKMLLTWTEELLKEAGISKGKITGIICMVGPGSYTGLRVGVAHANALAFGLGVPLSGINKYEIANEVYKEQYKTFNMVVPSYLDNVLMCKGGVGFDTKSCIMRSGDKVSRIAGTTILISDKTLTDKEKPMYADEVCYYQHKSILPIWFELGKKRLRKDVLVEPVYFMGAVRKKK
ncbi:tRNA (adenosine(37)-N6)-threonylcarbamoyltransferase complex dimerization subunit type 1 TsaB [Patescibacteria group bacterium]|nr:tRNA (adenosine(37)-N6)-threonylcarbamoyltransferase complex dimerization subunit type 1 TsaB [Patescibacteria group bacterium]